MKFAGRLVEQPPPATVEVPSQPYGVGTRARYWLTSADVAAIAAARSGGSSPLQGDPVAAGDCVPMTIVRVDGDGVVSGQAQLVGNDALAVRHAPYGFGPGNWRELA